MYTARGLAEFGSCLARVWQLPSSGLQLYTILYYFIIYEGMGYFCITSRLGTWTMDQEEVFALPEVLVIKTLLYQQYGTTSTLVPTHTMIAANYICLGWPLLHFFLLEVYAVYYIGP